MPLWVIKTKPNFNFYEELKGLELLGIASEDDFPTLRNTDHERTIRNSTLVVKKFSGALGSFNLKDYKLKCPTLKTKQIPKRYAVFNYTAF